MKYYKRNLGDYSGATRHLSMLEHGAYTLLLDTYYITEQPLPIDERALFRLVGARSKDEREAVEAVLADFFIKQEDGWHQERCDAEIGHKQHLSAINTETGKKGGRPKKQSESEPIQKQIGFETETETVSEKKPIQETEDKRQKTSPKPPAGFAEFWAVWPSSPRKVGRSECEKRWRAKSLEPECEAILAHVIAMKGTDQWLRGFEPAPLTYLNQRRWEDGAVGAESFETGGHANRV